MIFRSLCNDLVGLRNLLKLRTMISRGVFFSFFFFGLSVQKVEVIGNQLWVCIEKRSRKYVFCFGGQPCLAIYLCIGEMLTGWLFQSSNVRHLTDNYLYNVWTKSDLICFIFLNCKTLTITQLRLFHLFWKKQKDLSKLFQVFGVLEKKKLKHKPSKPVFSSHHWRL